MKFIWTFEHFSFHNSHIVRQRDIGTFTLAVLGSVLSEWQISAYFGKQMVWRNKTTRKLGGGEVVGQTWPAVKSFFPVYFIEDYTVSPSLTSRCLSSDGKRLCVCLILYVMKVKQCVGKTLVVIWKNLSMVKWKMNLGRKKTSLLKLNLPL